MTLSLQASHGFAFLLGQDVGDDFVDAKRAEALCNSATSTVSREGATPTVAPQFPLLLGSLR
jgi:hypothetical protein